MKNKLLSILYNGQSKKYGISILFLIFLTTNTALGATYYIDSVAGLDSNNGTAITTPWKSVTKVNSKTLVAGDKIYLKCGSVWNGEQLKFSGSGSAASPIIVDQYGTGAKPILNGNGLTTTDQGVVYLYNQQYIEINNLEITNYPTLLVYANSTAYTVNQIVYNGIYAYKVTVAGTSPASGGTPIHTSGTAVSGSVTFSYYCNLTNLSYPENMFFTGISDGTLTNNPLGADRRGVMVALKNKGSGTTAVANHIYLKNLYIHHIKGQLGNGSTTVNGAIPKRTGGIYFTVLDETTGNNSRFNDVLIDGCTISYSENVGLAFDNEDNVYYPGDTELTLWTARKFTNIKVSNNTIHHIGKNAMIIRCTDETGLIEHNTCYETALGTTGNTMFSARAKGTVFQYNEGYYNRATTQTVDPGTIDGSMYDPDYGSVGIIFQYSYSHDNSEGIYWGCNTRSLSNNTSGIPDPEDVGCTLRYNISQNDKGDLIFLNYSSAGNEIYNNIFYIKSGLSPNIIHENSGNNHTYNFYNNIIYNLGNGGYAFGSGTGIQTRTIQNNTFYGTHASDEPSDINKLTSNPLFVSPGAGTVGINSLLEGYKLQSGSPALSSGKLIATNGGFDFYGNSVSSSTIPNRGAYQGAAIVSVTPPPTANNQNFCDSLNPSVANLVATGTLLKWYANEIGGTALATSTILVTATYYVSQTISGVESSRTAVTVTVNTTESPLASAQVFCNLGTVADLVATGTNLQWYSAATGGVALATTSALTSGTYYLSQTLNGCESARESILVTVNTTSAPLASAQLFCNSGTVANLVAIGTALQWYVALTGESALATPTVLASGIYYVSQTLNGCESARISVLVTVNTTSAPSASAQVFCNSGTVADLVATGTNLQWYSAATGGVALATTSALTSGTYYLSQTLNGCESARTSVLVTVNKTSAPSASTQVFCNSGKVANLIATGTALHWYVDITGGSTLATTTNLASGTYYVSQTLNGCESARTSVLVTVNTTSAPSASAQIFCNSGTVADLGADGVALKWYPTITGGTALATTTTLASGTYYVSQTLNSCESARTSVAVTRNSTAAPTAIAQSFCVLSSPTIATLAATGESLKWYSVLTGGASLETNTALTARTYYVSQTLNGCESTRQSVVVSLTSGYSYFVDADGDGYGSTTAVQLCEATAPAGYATNNTDCDDNFISSASEVANGIDDNCNGLIDEGFTPPPPAVNSPLNLCKGQASVQLTATPISGYTLKWYATETIVTPLSAAPIVTSAVAKTYWVSQKLGSTGLESARTPITVNIIALPATPGTITTSDAVICKYIGTTNTVIYTVPASPGITFNWTVPTGANIIEDESATDNSITVDFLGASTSILTGGVGTIAARAVNSNTCVSAAARSLVLTSKLPTASTALVMTSSDTTPSFNLAGVPTALSTLTKITKVGPYMGTSTEFTLTAVEAPTAASYAWTLPDGVTQLEGGTSNVITVDFAGVASGIGFLPIVVKSVGGCGTSTAARTLNLARALPTAPAALVLTALASNAITLPVATADKITKVSPYVGKSTALTLVATPITVQGATATSYEWVFPSGVNSYGTTSETVNGVTTISSISNIITVDFEGVALGVLELPISVYAVNGAGRSLARTFKFTSAAPATPGSITTPAFAVPTYNPACSVTTITVQVPSVFGVSNTWAVGGSEASITSGQGTNSIVINVEAVTTATLTISVVGSNGTGTSLAAKTLTIKKVNTCREASNTIADEFNVIAYPNPSSSEFTLEVQSSSKGATNVQVYDMTGRLIENRQVNSNFLQVGRNYASGIYNVIVNRGSQVKTLRVIKQ